MSNFYPTDNFSLSLLLLKSSNKYSNGTQATRRRKMGMSRSRAVMSWTLFQALW